MCGFAGYYDNKTGSRSEALRCLKNMGETLEHRGPDSAGEWFDENSSVGLAHRRLAIQDLSPLGHQPMSSVSGRYTIAYNGEVYNFIELKMQLGKAGYTFRGNSDTEVMLAAFEKWGIAEALKKFTGMFAFSVFDAQLKKLTLARDRMGEKPLYYGWQKGSFVFSSELKALKRHSSWTGAINRNALTLLLRHNYIPTPHSIYENIHKLEPGAFLTLDIGTNQISVEKFWSLRDEYEEAKTQQMFLPESEIATLLEEKMLKTVERQLIANVPVGAFLSGGIDSSTVVALMNEIIPGKVNTFTIGFNETEHNEAEFARSISSMIGTIHTELYVTPEQTLDLIPQLSQTYDEPFADSSQIPTMLLSKMTRENVTVALSGDGGDELFCGYPHYMQMMSLRDSMSNYPQWLRTMMRNGVKGLDNGCTERIFAFFLKNLTRRNHYDVMNRLKSKTELYAASDLSSTFQSYLSYWKNTDVVLKGKEPEYVLNSPDITYSFSDDRLKFLQYLDMRCYLPDDILTKVDRAAMKYSLETRIPLLDHEIVEFSLRIPSDINQREGKGKWPLRRILEKYVPIDVFDRPKKGFSIPLGHWLRGPLRDWTEDLLDNKRLENQGYFDSSKVREIWHSHREGHNDYGFSLWGILMFQSWLNDHDQSVNKL